MIGILKSKTFQKCVLSIVLLDTVLLYIIAGNIFIYKRGFVNLFLIPKLAKTNIVGFFLPIIPFCLLFSHKENIIKHNVKDSIKVALYAPIIISFAYIVELILYFLIDPFAKNLAFLPSGLFSAILERNSVLYIFIYILHVCIWGYAITLFGLSIYHQTHNQYCAIAASFLVSRLSEYIPIVYGNLRVNIIEYLIPQLPFEISHVSDKLFPNLSQIVFLIFISLKFLRKPSLQLDQ